MIDRSLELAWTSLSVLQALLRRFEEAGVLTPDQVSDLLADAREAHAHCGRHCDNGFHVNVATIIERLRAGHDANTIFDERADEPGGGHS